MDDRVESMRLFDIDTQRSFRPVTELTLLPATGIVIDDDAIEVMRQNLIERGFSTDIASHPE